MRGSKGPQPRMGPATTRGAQDPVMTNATADRASSQAHNDRVGGDDEPLGLGTAATKRGQGLHNTLIFSMRGA
jgi:hypothetical protein